MPNVPPWLQLLLTFAVAKLLLDIAMWARDRERLCLRWYQTRREEAYQASAQKWQLASWVMAFGSLSFAINGAFAALQVWQQVRCLLFH
jgi:hypothetical protein